MAHDFFVFEMEIAPNLLSGAEMACEYATEQEEVILGQFYSILVPVWPHEKAGTIRERVIAGLRNQEARDRREHYDSDMIPDGVDRRHIVRRRSDQPSESSFVSNQESAA